MTTRLLVLGLLSEKSMTGYEIKQFLDQSASNKWAGVLSGSVYHALKKLEQEALIKIETVESTGMRQKARYSITEKGSKEVHDLGIQALKKGELSYPSSTYTAISFLNKINRAEALAALEENHQILLKELEFMNEGRKSKKEAEYLTPEIDMIFENINKQIELQINLIEQVKNHIKNKN